VRADFLGLNPDIRSRLSIEHILSFGIIFEQSRSTLAPTPSSKSDPSFPNDQRPGKSLVIFQKRSYEKMSKNFLSG
jgi:hypothetical protein